MFLGVVCLNFKIWNVVVYWILTGTYIKYNKRSMDLDVRLDNSSTYNTFKFAYILLDIKFDTRALNDLKMTLKTAKSKYLIYMFY